MPFQNYFSISTNEDKNSDEEDDHMNGSRSKFLKLSIHPEIFRLIAYINFWIMVGSAMYMTKLVRAKDFL